jgi:hypothetical protein
MNDGDNVIVLPVVRRERAPAGPTENVFGHPRRDLNVANYAERALIELVIDEAAERYRASAPNADLWDFSIHAMILLSDRLGNAKPNQTHNFLQTLAIATLANNESEMNHAAMRVAETLTALRQALRRRP